MSDNFNIENFARRKKYSKKRSKKYSKKYNKKYSKKRSKKYRKKYSKKRSKKYSKKRLFKHVNNTGRVIGHKTADVGISTYKGVIYNKTNIYIGLGILIAIIIISLILYSVYN